MVDEILYVNIGYENGLYTFDNDDICKEIPESIAVNTPFFNEENSLEELMDVIVDEPEDDVVLRCDTNNYPLVKRIAHELAEQYEKRVFIIGKEIKNIGTYRDKDIEIHLLNDYGQLMSGEDDRELSIDEIDNMEFDKKEERFNAGYYLAMKNGYDAFMTGIYPENISNTLAKHIKADNEGVFEDISQYLDINGALILDKATENNVKDKISHTHVADVDKIRFDNSEYSFKRCICSYEQFNKWKNESRLNSEIAYYLKLETKEDLKAFESELNTFEAEGYISTVETHLVDECRWTNDCSLKRMTRYEVLGDKVKPCITSDHILTDITTDGYEKVMEANKLCDQTKIKRNCVACEVSQVCSKCACLSEKIGKEVFCDFMHKYPEVKEYLVKKRIVNFLGKHSTIFNQASEIGVSSSVCGMEYPVKKTAGKLQTRQIYIFKKEDEYYYLGVQKGNLLRLDRKYVFLLEAWAVGEGRQDVVENMAERYNMTEAQAQKMVEEGYMQLEKGGMLNE